MRYLRPNPPAAEPTADFRAIARDVIAGLELDLERHGVRYRTGKGPADVLEAVARSRDPKHTLQWRREITDFAVELALKRDILLVGAPSTQKAGDTAPTPAPARRRPRA